MTYALPPLGRAAAVVFILTALAAIGAWPVRVHPMTGASVAGRPWQMPSVLVPVGTPIAGTVLTVNVGERRYVNAGTVLIELDPARYRATLEQTRARAGALASQVGAAQAKLAAGRHQAAAGVSVAVDSASTMPPLPSLPPVAVPKVDTATKAQLVQAQQQIVAARTEVLNDAQAEAASWGRTVDRDRALLAQGLIAARQLDADTAAYQAAQAQVAAARTALRNAQAGTAPASSGNVAQAQGAIAAAQRAVSAARADEAAATRAVDRDKALAAQGAVAVRQITADTVTQDAARARLAAATAELHRAQAALAAAKADAAAAAAFRRQTEILQQAEAVRARHAAQTRALAQRAAFTIVTAAQSAQALAALETEAVNAQNAVRRAEADLAATVVRAPAGGWVLQPIARPGDAVRAGQSVAVLAVDARSQAAATSGAPSAGRDGTAPQFAQIASSERQVLAELNAEAARISTISAMGGTGLSALPYTGAGPFDHARGSIPTLLNGGMPRPLAGPITSGYGWRIHPIFDTPEFHTGVDIAASMGASIDAPAPGTVIFAGALPANGTLVILDHGGGVTTTYSHLSSYGVYVGEHVQRGQVIARVGNTGWSTGPHLFFEIRKNGHPINPLSL